MRQMRCLTEEIAITGPTFGLRIGLGQVVDFDQPVSGTMTIGDAVAGRQDCFEAAEPPAPTTRARAARVPDSDAPADAKE
jgi:hypothetical protein